MGWFRRTTNRRLSPGRSGAWLYCTKSGRQVQKATVITENLFFEHRRARFFIFPEFFNIFPQPQTKPEVQKISQSKVISMGKWPHRPVLVCFLLATAICWGPAAHPWWKGYTTRRKRYAPLCINSTLAANGPAHGTTTEPKKCSAWPGPSLLLTNWPAPRA